MQLWPSSTKGNIRQATWPQPEISRLTLEGNVFFPMSWISHTPDPAALQHPGLKMETTLGTTRATCSGWPCPCHLPRSHLTSTALWLPILWRRELWDPCEPSRIKQVSRLVTCLTTPSGPSPPACCHTMARPGHWKLAQHWGTVRGAQQHRSPGQLSPG